MKKKYGVFILLAILLCALLWADIVFEPAIRRKASVGLSEVDTSASLDGPQLHWSRCQFDTPRPRDIQPRDIQPRDIQCGTYATPSKRRAGAVDQFLLPVVIIKDHSPDHQNDPVIFLAGGPGDASQLSADSMEYWLYWLDRAQLSRDFILFDQRGTGQSQPNIDCDAYDRLSRRLLGQNIALEKQYQQSLVVLRDCLLTLSAQGFDHQQFSTSLAAVDVRGLMRALDYDQWNLLGVSYGTRLALEVASTPPSAPTLGLRSAILDSPYPLDKGLLTEWPWLLNDALQRLWHACAADRRAKICPSADFPLETIFWQAMARLRDAPVTVTVKHWQGEAPIKVLINDDRLLGILYSALYDANLYPEIAPALAAVIKGETPLLQNLAESFANYLLDGEFSNMVYFATECADNPLVTSAAYEKARAAHPLFLPYTDFAWEYDICRELSPAPVAESITVALADQPSQMPPALILSGQLDPVTPPSWAENLTSQLESSQLLVFPGIGHAVINSSDCAHGLIRSFLDHPQRKISADCLNGG